MQRAAEQDESIFRTPQTPREPGTLVSCKLALAAIQSLLKVPSCAGFSHSLHEAPSVFPSAGSFYLQCQDQNTVSTGLLTQIVTKKVNNQNHTHFSGGGSKDKRLDYPCMLQMRQGELQLVHGKFIMATGSLGKYSRKPESPARSLLAQWSINLLSGPSRQHRPK